MSDKKIIEALERIAGTLDRIDTKLTYQILSRGLERAFFESSESQWLEVSRLVRSLDQLKSSEDEIRKIDRVSFSEKMLAEMEAKLSEARSFWDEKDRDAYVWTFGQVSKQLFNRHDYSYGRNGNNKLKQRISDAIESGRISSNEVFEEYLSAKNFREANKVKIDASTLADILPIILEKRP